MIITENPIYERAEYNPVFGGRCSQCECSFECNYDELLDTEDGFIAKCPCCDQSVKVDHRKSTLQWTCLIIFCAFVAFGFFKMFM